MLRQVVISATHATNDDLFTELSTETGERKTGADYGGGKPSYRREIRCTEPALNAALTGVPRAS
jgi:hypothetical protein